LDVLSLAYDFKAGKFTKCTILASRFIEWESEEESIQTELVELHEELDERIDREIELEERLQGKKDFKFIAQRNLWIMENRGTR